MKRLSFLLILLVVLGAMFPVAAQDNPYDAITEEELNGVTVEFWHQHTGGRAELLDAIVQDFNDTNPYGITVVASNQGGYDDIFNKMNANLATGGDELPELTVAYANQAVTYQVYADGIVDMDTLVNSEVWGLPQEELDDFIQSFLSTDYSPVANDGEFRLAFPPNRSMEMVYVNIDWLDELREAGAVTFEGLPQSPEQFAEAACAATANPWSAAVGDASQSIGYQLNVGASSFASWTFAFGGDIYDYENDMYSYNNEAAVEAMTYLQGLYADGCAGGIAESFGNQTNFGNGITLMTTGSTSGLPFYRAAITEAYPDEFAWTVTAHPYTTEEPVTNIYGASVTIPRSTPVQELAAWLFVKYYTTSEVQAEWAAASNYFPVRNSSTAGLADYIEQNPAYQDAFSFLEFGRTEPAVPGYDFVRVEVDVAMAAIMNGADVQETLDDLNELANEILEEQLEN